MLSNFKYVILGMLRALERSSEESTTGMAIMIAIVIVAILALDIRERVFEGIVGSTTTNTPTSSTAKRMFADGCNIIIVVVLTVVL